jgi:O-antigen/teichoic acid export membrane protein
MLTSGLAAGANLILNAVLIPPLGALGAAIATAVSYGLCFISRLFDTGRLLKFRTHNLRFLANTALITASAAGLYINIFGKPWLLTIGIFIVICIINLKSIFGILYILRKRFIKNKTTAEAL